MTEPRHDPTPQQVAVVDWFRDPDGDLCVTARAGSGKTSTILAGVFERRGGLAMLCAFNRRIADELIARTRGWPLCRTNTLHGIGRRAIAQHLRRPFEVNARRERDLAELVCGDQADDKLIGGVARLASLAKEIAPDQATDPPVLAQIALDFGMAPDEDDGVAWGVDDLAGLAAEVVERSVEVTADISFADMLYIPIRLRLRPDQADLVCVDEAQDMNLAQLRLAARVRRAGGSIVVVGDPRQAIYGWRGAAPGALETVATALRARRLSLTVSFRCGRAIVAEARRIVTDIEAAPGAHDGIVRTVRPGDLVAGAAVGDFVLSRTNAALAPVCLSLLRAGIPARIVGRDIAAGIVALIQKLSRGTDSIAVLLARLEIWRERETAKAAAADAHRRVELVRDQAELIKALAGDVADLAALSALIDRLFDDDDSPKVQCSTVHKAKGLEADRVWVLSESFDQVQARTPIQEVEEANLRYVAITRARHELVWVNP